MALVNRSFSVNVTPGMMPPIVHVSEYDVGRAYTVSILDEQGNTFTIPSGTTASIEGTLNGSVGFTQSATVGNNQVSFTLSESMTAYSGKAWCKIKLVQNSQPIQTCAFVLAVDRAGVEADTVIGAPGFEEQINQGVANYLDDHQPFFTLPEGGSYGQPLVSDGDGGALWGGNDTVNETIEGSKTIYASADGANISRLILHGKTTEIVSDKNLCSLGTVTVTGVQQLSCEPIPAGGYTFSGFPVGGNPNERLSVGFYDENGTSLATKSVAKPTGSERVSFHVTLSATCTKITIYAGGGWQSSQAYTVTWNDIQIEEGNEATDYVPYGGGSVGVSPSITIGSRTIEAESVSNLFDGDTVNLLTGAYYNAESQTTETVAITGSVAGLYGNLLVTTPSALDITYEVDEESGDSFFILPSGGQSGQALLSDGDDGAEWGDIRVDTDVSIKASDEYVLVVGDTFELFWRGILNCKDPYKYYIEAVCDRGKPFKHRFIYTPVAADVGTHNLKVSVYNDSRTLLAEKTIFLRVLSAPASPSTAKNVLYIGDSLVVGGVTVDELKRRLVGSGGTPTGNALSNINFIGSKETSNGTKFVGYGGWSYQSYLNESKSNAFMWITASAHGKTADDQHSVYKDSNNVQWRLETIETGRIKIIRVSDSGTLPSAGTLTWVSGGENHAAITYTASEQAAGNPFWNPSTNAVDFAWYAQQQGISSIDYVFILLGWNNWKSFANQKTDVVNFLGKIRSAFPNCKICLLGLELPSADGAANNYGASATWNEYGMTQHVWEIDSVNASVAADMANVYAVNVSGQFDTEHNMQKGTRPVNVRNSETETYGTNGVHPATSGYLQIADAAYRAMVEMLS